MKNHSTFIRLLSLLLAVLTLATLPLSAFAAEEADTDTTIADMELPEPIEDGEDPFGGISLFAYNYNKIPGEMLDNSILRALAYTGYDVAYLKSIKKLYNKSYIASSLLENAPDVLSGIGYSSDGSGSGLQTVSDSSTPTGKAPDIEHFKEETGLDCADFVAYYMCNYLPNIEGVDVSMLDEMKEKYGYRQDDMRFWMAGCEDLASQGRCTAYILEPDDYRNNTTAYQTALANSVPGDIIRFGTDEKDWVHYAIYAGSYDGEDYIIHVGNKRGPEISLIRYMASSSSKASVPVAFYHFDWDDTEEYGAIEVYKKDTNGKALAGAEFTAVHKETGTKYLIGPTNSSGYAKKEMVLYGDYTVTETKFPSGYQSSGTTTWTVTVGDDTPTVTINATNKLITGSIGIKKTNDTGKALSGVQFGVYSNSGCTTSVGTITTNSSGVATMTGLTPGTTYYLKEKAAPTGHIYNGTVYSVKVVANTTTYANNGEPVVNTRMGKIRLIKEDKNGSLGAGYAFNIYSDEECATKVTAITTNSSGIATSGWLAPGTYYVREISVPSTDTTHTVSTIRYIAVVKTGEITEITVINPLKKGTVGVLKEDDKGTPMEGVMFGIYYDAECTQMATAPFQTNAEGIGTVSVDIGSYYVQEYEVLDGYVVDKTVYPVTVEADKTTFINNGEPVVNTRMGKIQIIKKDKNGSLGADYQFRIYSDADCTIRVATVTTDSSGIAVSGWLAPGTYYVREYKLSDDDTTHELSTIRYKAVVDSGETVEVTVINPMKKGMVGVLKADDKGTPMQGVMFGIYYDAECTQMASSPASTDANGLATWQLDIGTYYVQEYSTIPGYIIDKTAYPVTVEADKTTFVNDGDPVVNVQEGHIKVIKKDKNGSLGAGYVFGIYSDADGTNQIGTMTTNSSGIATSGGLAPGTYYVYELQLPDDDTTHEMSTIRYKAAVKSGETVEVTVTNPYRKGTIGVLKTDDTGTPLVNVMFAVYLDPECTQLATSPFLTNAEGIATTQVDIGVYYVQEYSELPGYVVDKTVYPVTVVADKTTYVNKGDPVVNTRMGWIRIIKTDPDDSLGAGYVFGIYSDADCTDLVETITTNDNGIATSGWLVPSDAYYVKELSIPDTDIFHSRNEQAFPVQVLPGETTEVKVENPFLPGQITILKKSQQGEDLAGAKFLLEWSEDGENWQKTVYNDVNRITKGTCASEGLEDSCLITDSTGIITFTGLHPKLYYRITELEAPERCLLLTDYVYTGQLPEDTLELDFTVVNAKTFELPKTGTTSMTLMPVALLLCTVTCMGVLLYLRKKKES